MFKKLLLVSLVALMGFTLSACGTDEYTVTFDVDGGSAVSAVVVEDGEVIDAPANPTKAPTSEGKVYSFVAWYTTATGTTAYDFDDPVTEDLTLYAGWSLDVVLHFDTKTTESIAPQLLGEDGGAAVMPTDTPTRTGFEFAGWFLTKRGLTWLETEAITFPLNVTEETTIYAYWEPINSKTMDYSDDETYTTSIDDSSFIILNPLVYEWSHEDAFIDMMATPLYEDDIVDWDKAIEEGVADFAGDFSKIIAKEFSIEALDYINILVGATQFPVDSEGEEHLTVDGLYDRDNAGTFMDTEWTFHIREDLYYEDGTHITAADWEYTLKMFLSNALNNSRASLYFKTEEDKNGVPILNAYEYYTGTAVWADVGFEIIDDYTFTLTTFESIPQTSAVAFGNIRLVQEEAFEASLDTAGTNSSYGTPDYPYVSYGEYIMKSWDENAKIVFNKNYDYILKGTINYKSYVIEVVTDEDQKMALFAAGDLSVAGLTKDYYEQFAESPNIYKAWGGYPQYLIINVADSLLTEGAYVHPTIMYDERFRQALLFGFDRQYYANSVYAPNTASFLPIPLDTKSYIQDALYYSESPQHLAVLEAINVDPATEGYIPELAITLFDAAYAEWVAIEGNSGAVEIKFITDNDPFGLDLVEYIEGHYEELFGIDKIDIVVYATSGELADAETENWNFDIKLTSVGFGSSSGAWWQYPFISMIPAELGGGFLGLSMPFDGSTDSGFYAFYEQEVTVDLKATFAYMQELGVPYMTEAGLSGHLALYDELLEILDGTTVVKEAGMFVGSVSLLADLFMLPLDTPFDGVASEPFPGATSDSWNYIAAFEAIFYEHAPLIPTVTRSSATIYAENVMIEWPAYSAAFGWGTARYRYLDTDTDFQ